MNEIIPRVSVGRIRFDANVETLNALGYVEDIESFDDFLNWHTYRNNGEITCYVKNGLIICIACFSNCGISGVCLIGKLVNELVSILGAPDEIGEKIWVDDDREQIPYEYFEKGLQIWFEDDRVVSVYCNSEY